MKKKFMITCLALLLPCQLNAQEAPKQFNLTVTPEELQVIGKALEELPFKQSAPLMNKLNTQVQAQVNPPKPKPEENK